MSPLLYCQRDYTADKNARAAWAFAQVYPEAYNNNPDATYAYWVDKVYHINLADVPTVATYMTNKSVPVTYTQGTVDDLEANFATGGSWWNTTGSDDPYWSDFAYYTGSSRASYYSDNTASEEPAYTIGIFAPTLWWVDTGVSPAAARTLSVTRVEQAQSNWCWAATSEMVGNYLYPSTDRTQWDVVFDRAGITELLDQLASRTYAGLCDLLDLLGIDIDYDLNQDGNAADVCTGIGYITHGTVSTSWGSTLSIATHYAEIDSGQPVAVRMGWTGGGGHWLVASGYEDRNTSIPELVLVDPWQNTPTRAYPYSALTTVCAIGTGTGTYTHSAWVTN
jgi:hypothetical protein